MARNIELKARARDLSRMRSLAIELGATSLGVEDQCDTFFTARVGRLKLREIAGKPAYLIGYRRSDNTDACASDYTLVPVPDPVALTQALTATLGVVRIVRKVREILRWHNVRIHLDEVAGLGTFVEFEAVLNGAGDDGNEQVGHQRLATLAEVLEIRAADRIAVAYADLLAEQESGG